MSRRPVAGGTGQPPRSGREAGDGGADFLVAGVERSGAQVAGKLGEPSMVEAARSPPDNHANAERISFYTTDSRVRPAE